MSPARATTTSRGDRARLRIVDTGEALFGQRGFHGVSVRDLAAAAQMPTASLLHYFPAKEKLYAAVLQRIAKQLGTVTADLRSDRPPGERLSRLVEALTRWALREPHKINLLTRELLDNEQRVETAGRFPLAEFVEDVAAFIVAGQRTGEFRPVDPTFFIVHFAGSVAYLCAARPTLDRLGLLPRGRALAPRFRRDLLDYAQRALLTEVPR